ncbi:MAG: hypothetical protein HC786_30955 [Richelia sp. CSU_2_1]|nr:hypothetical protein [Microcoleus sp. SU_5_6]NJR26208.1 hypothetical protein [Richelia sp. CSU_2_1]
MNAFPVNTQNSKLKTPYQFPIPNSQFPIPNSQFPTINYQLSTINDRHQF